MVMFNKLEKQNKASLKIVHGIKQTSMIFLTNKHEMTTRTTNKHEFEIFYFQSEGKILFQSISNINKTTNSNVLYRTKIRF